MIRFSLASMIVATVVIALPDHHAHAQTYGIELHNTLMPASAGMAGASLAEPQDIQSAINGNPATLTQMQGTQFSFGGAWAEPTYNIEQTTNLPLAGVSPYSAKSQQPGSALGNIGVTQDVTALGLPATFGIGLMSNAGLGIGFRDVPESNGTSAQYLALDMVVAGGVDLTERLSVGASVFVGISYLDGPFAGNGAMVLDYGLRGSLGMTYDINCDTTLGAYWQSKKHFRFEDAISFNGGAFQDINLDHPENFGIGIANRTLMDGCLLVACDVLYKRYSEADFFQAIYKDQWVLQLGAQYELSRKVRLRAGYGYNENPMRDSVLGGAGGVIPPDGIPAMRYVQGQFASMSQHRITGGIGCRDVLPGIDLDLSAGGMFENSDTFSTTTATIESYWLAFGLTWRFGRGACERLPVPDHWSGDAYCEE
jgi:long-chain fatty acid transport protein